MKLLASWFASPPPVAAVEIAPMYVSAATVVSRRSSGVDVAVRDCAVEPLPSGAIAASIGSDNIIDRRVVTSAIRAVLARLKTRTARVALVIPDLSAKVSLIRFDDVPARREDLDRLIRWHVRKSAPFPIEDACVTYSPAARRVDGGAEFVVALARRDIVEEYEGVCGKAGAYAGLVDLSTFSLLNLVLRQPDTSESDCLAVHVRPEYTSIAIVRSGDVIFFRSRPEGRDETLADVVHQATMYYQDRLSGDGFARVLLGGHGRESRALSLVMASLQERFGLAVELIDSPVFEDGPGGIGVSGAPADILAPLAGILLRTRQEAMGI